MKRTHMSFLSLIGAAAMTLATPALAQGDVIQGDVAEGEKDFRKCRSCHTIASEDQVFVKGGRTGPNLYGVVGRAAAGGSFKYSKSMIEAGEAGLIWTPEAIVAYVADPTGYLKEVTGDGKARSKMTFKLKDATDVAAYLASLAPLPAATE